MDVAVKNIFFPSVGIDIVFDMDSLNPESRSSIIYDVDYPQNRITIAQPIVPITKETPFNQLHLTTIAHVPNHRQRIGIPCKPVQFIEKYPLANNEYVQAIVLEYAPTPKETNIRSAFRLPLSLRHTIQAKLLYQKTEFFTSKDFKVKDVSFAGIGLVVPKIVRERVNPLSSIPMGTSVPFGMILVDKAQKEPVAKFPVKTRVARINTDYSNKRSLVGLKILNISAEHESTLNKFIHNAQIDELKRLSKRGS